MTNENIIKQLKRLIPSLQYADDVNAVKGAIQALSQEPCDDAISRDAAIKALSYGEGCRNICANAIRRLPSVTQKSGKCKNCKYFEYDSVAKVDGVPLIVAHEICSKWGDGCKTKEDGYCFLYEPQEGSE